MGTHREYDDVDPEPISLWKFVLYAPKRTTTPASKRSRPFRDEPGSPEADRFDLLALVIADYERKHWAIEAPVAHGRASDPVPRVASSDGRIRGCIRGGKAPRAGRRDLTRRF